MEHHLEAVGKDELSKIIKFDNKNPKTNSELLISNVCIFLFV